LHDKVEQRMAVRSTDYRSRRWLGEIRTDLARQAGRQSLFESEGSNRILGLSREQADSVPLQERMAGGAYFGRLIRQVENVMV